MDGAEMVLTSGLILFLILAIRERLKIFKLEDQLERANHIVAKYHNVLGQHYWFSEWTFLNPIWDFVKGDQDVSRARDEFREMSAKTLGYSLEQIKQMEDEIAQLKQRVGYFEGIIERTAR